MMHTMWWIPQAVVLALVVGLLPAHVQGQITTRIETDGTLPGTVPVVVPDGGGNGLYEIPETLGWRPDNGTNLFHSFEFFDVGEDNTAFFTANSGLLTFNVLARVTGGLPSLIDGRIASLVPNADVWFMNPSGILFGPGGKLDVPRAFHATTADYLGFGDGSRFYGDPALDGVAGSVLDVSDPPDFGLLGSPLAFGFTSDEPAFLDVLGSELFLTRGFQTLSLVGGDVRIEGADLFVPDGVIRIASVGSAGEVRVSGDGFELVGFDGLGDLTVVGSVLDARGFFDGSIVLRGGEVFVGFSDLVVARLPGGAGPRGGVGIDIEGEDVQLVDAFLTTPVFPGATVAGAPIRITGDSVTIEAETRIRAQTFEGSASDGGDVTIKADRLVILGELVRSGNPDFISIRVETFGTGRGGDLVLEAGEIVLDEAARVLAGTNGPGRGGDVRVIGGDVRIDNFSELVDTTDDEDGKGGDFHLEGERIVIAHDSIVGTLSSNGSLGDAGDLTVRAGRLELRSDGVLQSSSFGGGDSGDIDIEADSVLVSGEEGSPFPGNGTLLSTQAFITNLEPGASGNLTIRAREIEVLGGERFGTILTQNDGANPGGNIRLEADSIVIGTLGNVNAASLGSGGGGQIELIADSVDIAGAVFATASGSGRGGDILVSGDQVDVTGAVSASAAFVELVPPELSTGDGGDVTIDANQIAVRGGRVSSSTVTQGSGGSVTLIGHESVLLTQEGELASSTSGPSDGGIVTVRTPLLSMRDGGSIATESSAEGLAGNVVVDVGDLDMQGSRIVSDAISSEGGDIDLRVARRMQLSDSSISASVDGGDGGSVTVRDAQVLVLRDASSITARAASLGGTGGRIELGAESVFIEYPLGPPPYGRAPEAGDSFVDASAPGGPEAQGEVIIQSPVTDVEGQATPLDVSFLDAVSRLSPSCAARASEGGSGSFAVARHRGLPAAADDLLIAYDEVSSTAVAELPSADVSPAIASVGPGAASTQLAQASLASAAGAFRGGRFELAAEEQSRAAELLEGEGDVGARVDAVRALAQSQLALGRYGEAAASLEEASKLIDASQDPARAAALESSLGNAYLAMGDGERAEGHLERGTELAAESGDTALAAQLSNNLGNLRSARGRYPEAIAAYERSASLAAEASRPLAETKALSNGARAALESGDSARASAFLARAKTRADALPEGFARAGVSIHLAGSYERLATALPGQRQAALLSASAELNSAAAIARELEEPRTLSRALGELGHLYEGEGRSQEALLLTRAALRESEAAHAPELGYRWYWQEARLLWAEGKASASLRAYRRAFEILEETRQETLSQYGSAELRFRRAVAPVYRDFAAALLESSDLALRPQDAEQFLIEARAVMERFKAAELRDYFRDECVAEVEAQAVDLDRVSRASSAAVIYPVVLPDRLELLLSLPSGIARRTVPVSAADLQQALVAYRTAVSDRGGYEFLAPSQQLFDWLVRPYLEELESEQVDTLVFVPDGALRTVPLAALHDGEQFLVQRYAVAVTPGLSLVDPRPLDTAQAKLLLAGLSEATQGFPELPNAGRELEAIQALYGGEVLLNEDFGTTRFEGELATEQPNIVHVASHAVFARDSAESFLLTHDGRLSMSALSDAIAPTQFRQRPVELLTLSACETAVGDERAALGLAGVALRAGARSAMGSLWRIQDEATYLLVLAFYEELANPGVSKAEALRRAQQTLLADLRFAHPYYWSSFLLISNWL